MEFPPDKKPKSVVVRLVDCLGGSIVNEGNRLVFEVEFIKVGPGR